MRTPQFFLDKATEYYSSFKEIFDSYIPIDIAKLFNQPDRDKQQREINELKLNTKMLLTEFDKGRPLLDEIKRLEGDLTYSLKSGEKMDGYMSVLQSFISHLREFRISD